MLLMYKDKNIIKNLKNMFLYSFVNNLMIYSIFLFSNIDNLLVAQLSHFIK